MLEINKYTSGYNKNQYLFKEISLRVSKGNIIGIRGFNGCGKSTFIKGIINLTPVKKGKIFLNNINITNWETSKIFRTNQIGYLSQRNRIFDHLTVYEHLKLQLHYSKNNSFPESQIYNNFFSIIESKQKFLASTLSGGEKLILNLLCLLISDPDVLLLDEPSDSLDLNFKDELKGLLSFWKNSNKSILLVEQNISFQKTICDRIIKII